MNARPKEILNVQNYKFYLNLFFKSIALSLMNHLNNKNFYNEVGLIPLLF